MDRRGLCRIALGCLVITRAFAVEVGFAGPDAASVRRLAAAAARSVQEPHCLAVLQRLGGPAASPDEAAAKLHSLRFEDGGSRDSCRRGTVYAETTVGGDVVWICPDSFRGLEDKDGSLARAVIVHELLHTLGLREAPAPGAPTSREITKAALQACR